jgi:hypothetical protein
MPHNYYTDNIVKLRIHFGDAQFKFVVKQICLMSEHADTLMLRNKGVYSIAAL